MTLLNKRPYNMRLNEKELDIQISCDRRSVYEALHQAIDTVLKLHYSPPTLKAANDEDCDKLVKELTESLELYNRKGW